MNLSNRVERFENKAINESSQIHVITPRDEETMNEAITRYCQKNKLSPEKLNNGELGLAIKVIHE